MSSEKSKQLKIAFHLKAHSGWTAGTVYLKTLFEALKSAKSSDLQIGVIGRNGELSSHRDLCDLADEVIVYPPIDKWTWAWVVHSLGTRLLQRDFVNEQLLGQYNVNVIAFGEAPEGSKIPSLGWIPDFQHLHFPEFFSLEERHNRDTTFARLIERSARVILISESAKRDFESFAPQAAYKARVLKPITAIPSTVYAANPELICEQYNLERKFFYLPNQFWKHKNHITVFRALRRLKERGLPVSLVCSGSSGDYRDSAFFSELLLEISRLGIRDQVILLGVLPREHVFQLMRQSICVLNPSLFEGYGMTVDEGRALGKRMLLSDISAHREQDPAGAVFFDPLASNELADKMEQVWRETTPGPNTQVEAQTQRGLSDRMRAYGESFIEIGREVAD